MVKLNLYSERDNSVQAQAGLNWGLSDGHVCKSDAYIAIPKKFIEDNERFFPSHGNAIQVVWDDGEEMNFLLEGTQEINGIIYPKQISTAGDKSIFGEYIRNRLRVSSDHQITMVDLEGYGRNDVGVEYLGGNKYRFDFGV